MLCVAFLIFYIFLLFQLFLTLDCSNCFFIFFLFTFFCKNSKLCRATIKYYKPGWKQLYAFCLCTTVIETEISYSALLL